MAGADVLRNLDPCHPDRVVGLYASATAADAEAAVRAARRASRDWARSGPQRRFDLLDACGSEILARQAELAELLTREEGKTLPEAMGEVARAGATFKFYAGEALRLKGELQDSVRPGVRVEVTREPVGVVGLICPWNFPIAIPAWKIAPALAYGNTVVCKPAELTPGCAWALAEILHRHGCPAGVFNLVMGEGPLLGPVLLDGCDALSFTGSVEVGTQVRDAAAIRGKRVQCEMGGKNPLVVLDDADLANAVDCALNGAFFCTGHRCTASSRLIVTEGIADAFVAGLAQATAALTVGDPLAPGTRIGPCASLEQQEIAREAVAQAVREGAVVVAAGKVEGADPAGFFYPPTLLDRTTPAMAINRKEVFGPVASIIRVKDFQEAPGRRQRLRLRPVRRDLHAFPQVGRGLQARQRGRRGDGESPHRGH